MSALHDALKTLGPLDFTDTPLDKLGPFLSEAFTNGQLIVDSVPIPAPSDGPISSDNRSRASSTASNASEISLSSARSPAPPSDVEALQKDWKQVKLNAKENPLGMNVYKLGGKDGKGAWFARRSVHEGLGFTKWKKGLEREFPETMKVQGGPGEGNIRGIGGEKRVEYTNVEGVGKMEVYLLSAQFPGPTTPRDFVTMFLTSDQALCDTHGKGQKVPRHFMVISRPCAHPETPPRDGYIRGQYESVEFIREIPINNGPRKSFSTTNLSIQPQGRNRSSTLGKEAILRNAEQKYGSHESETTSNFSKPEHSSETADTQAETGRARGKTISFDKSRGTEAKGEDMDIPREDEDCEDNPIEWIMITRSDPGGSVPRFMIERGTPGGIVADASKFLNWACAKDMEELDSDDDEEKTLAGEDQDQERAQKRDHDHERDLHNFQTNGHLSGLEDSSEPNGGTKTTEKSVSPETSNSSTLYDMATGAALAAGTFIASHTPHMVTDHLPANPLHNNRTPSPPRRSSISSISTISSSGSFASAVEKHSTSHIAVVDNGDPSSLKATDSALAAKTAAAQDKELQKLEERKRKLDEKLNKAREKESSKKSEDSVKEEEAIRRAEEKHQAEVRKAEEKHKREVEKLEFKKKKEEQKVADRKRKAEDKDEKTRMTRQIDEMTAEVQLLRKEKDLLRNQVGDLQAENTALAARLGKLGMQGEEVLKDVRAEVGRGERLRAISLKGLGRNTTLVGRPGSSASSAMTGGSGSGSGEKVGAIDRRVGDESENEKLLSTNGLKD